jgi:hypothetical protein
MEAMIGSQREEFDEMRGFPTTPFGRGNLLAAHDHAEAAQ